MRSLLHENPNLVNELDDVAKNVLVNAVKEDQTEMIRLMLEAGFDVAFKGELGATTLHWAAWHGQADAGKLLLQHEAPIDVNDETFRSQPLGWATHGSSNCQNPKGDYLSVVQHLLGAGAIVREYMIQDATDDLKATLRRSKKRQSS